MSLALLWLMIGVAQATPDAWHISMDVAQQPEASQVSAEQQVDGNAQQNKPAEENPAGENPVHAMLAAAPSRSSPASETSASDAPVSHMVHMPRTPLVASEAAAEAATMDDAEARALLDYKLYERVEAAMRARIKQDAYDGPAWLILGDALQAEGRADEAAEARRRARQYGSGERSWHVALKLAGLVDSNVVIAPDAVHVAAQDQGDIGGRIALSAYGRMLERDWGHTSWLLSYQDMLYQDFNTFALRRLQAAAAEHLNWGEDGDIFLGAQGEQASLGGNSFYAGWQGTAGLSMPLGEDVSFRLDGGYGKRNFTAGFSDFSSWRWRVTHHLDWQGDGHDAGFEFAVAKEQTRLGAEAYRQLGGALKGGWRAFDFGALGAFWLRGKAGFNQRNYRQLDSRPFLKTPLQRKDQELKLVGEIQWLRPTTVWGGDIGETWRLQGGWQRNSSNMDVQAVFDPAQSRDWKRWWSEVSVQWAY
ncbi:MAG: hypothetical protein R8L58_05435 [Mariprofundaceae bacterium]